MRTSLLAALDFTTQIMLLPGLEIHLELRSLWRMQTLWLFVLPL